MLQPPHPRQRKHRLSALAALGTLAGLAALAGCAALPGAVAGASSYSGLPLYRCEQGLTFTVRFVDDTAVLTGARGDDVLLRDAGGEGAQTVYSSAHMRAEFGLGAGGREAVLHYPPSPEALRCVRD
ncbi:MAG: hypothetical protein ACWA6Y_09265 [Polaromonas sp.]